MSTLSITPTFHSTTRPGANRAEGRPTSSVRLTRRGRLVVFMTAMVLVLAAAFFFASGAAGTDEAGTPPETEIVLVGPGDTLWGIASDVAVDGDVRSTMTEIQRLNALDSVGLQTGQKLRVPAAD